MNTVKISGAVMHPNAVTYLKKMKYKDYIENAGGYSVDAKKRRAYVLYPNGTLAVCKGIVRRSTGKWSYCPLKSKDE